jgi:signal transduction histidine kinase
MLGAVGLIAALAVLAAGGLLLALGGLALSRQRKELQLSADLAVLERERDERLERLDKAATLGVLAIVLAHEVSTPLGVITGRAEQVLPKVKNDQRATIAVEAILEQATRISEIIRALLSLAREQPGPFQPIAPHKIAQAARALVEHRFVKAGVRLDEKVGADLPEIHGDPLLLEHALVNLLLNACEACDRGGQVVMSVENGGGAVRFEVEDDGVGITRDAASRASEPFFTTKATSGGAGLGLAIVNEILTNHGGRFAIAPRSSRGTTARIEIPKAVSTKGAIKAEG